MADFFTGRGLVVSVKNKRSSAYKLTGGAMGQLFSASPSGGSIALIGNILVSDKDIGLPVVCTDDYRAIYSFGRDFGQVSIVGTAFLGPADGACGGSSKVLKQLINGFESDRLSKKKKPCKFSIAGAKAWPVYFVQLELKSVNGELNSVDFSLDAVLAAKA